MWRNYSIRKTFASELRIPNVAPEDPYYAFFQRWGDLIYYRHQLALQPALSPSSADQDRPTQSLIASARLRSVLKMAPIAGSIVTLSLVLLFMCLPTVYTSPIDVAHATKTEAGKFGAVASESEHCSRYGSDMLRKGGNAADSVSLPWRYIVLGF